ncbi:glycerol-3-phosphate 1-O-acyltransferase PlsY [Rhodocaloribacter litoris]|uniref:glycerol-3-phosphate 1-O-acyltransferase PlsY n=1 Tax=Rhodocaloribacter litoris TaxID=2558931 RepID=UPI001420DBC8|nr:glycerol-3-phosphate 1-O-acyltransferase PlsY [Rhodocaloribacter litoris]QXD15343.1 glycerol-3-phosphate 1-O-acyltransferase PlsY [Rhodocaloribacter litoris]
MLSIAVIVVLSYLAGSIPGSVWVGKWLYGIDIRHYGSGNAGATNVFRVLGWKAGVLATVVDLGKGLLAAGVIATIRLDDLPSGLAFWHVETFVRMLAGLAAIVGHMFPVWAGFKGGKGVNTAAGVLFALSPVTMLITLGVFALVLLTSRYVSLASLTATIAFPSAVAIRKYLFHVDSLDGSLLIISILMALGIIYAHRANIRRLLNGTENRVRTFRPARGMRGRGEL